MDYRLLVDTAVLAGEIMMSNGAETHRVEDTMARILNLSKMANTETFSIMTGIVVTLSDPSMETITVVKRVQKRSNNLNKVYLTNCVSRELCDGKINLNEAYDKLQEIKESVQYTTFEVNLAIILTTSFFALLLGGSAFDCIFAFVAGTILSATMYYGESVGANAFLLDLVSCAAGALVAMILPDICNISANTDVIIVGVIMPLVPGVAITNAIRDTLHGDYLSGGGRAIEAFVKAASIAMGVIVGMYIYKMLVSGGVI